jgi:hypothetical protein
MEANMIKTILCWGAVPVLLLVLSYLAATGQLRRQLYSALNLDPIIEYPATVDLGDHEAGDLVHGSFIIANRGGGDLVVDQVRTNCACSGIERIEEGRYVRIDFLRLKPGEQADLTIRVTVGGVPVEARMVNVVEFRTNVPSQPMGRMEVLVRRVSGSVSMSPPSIVFGTVPVGTRLGQIVQIYDMGSTPRAIERITMTGTGRIRARLLPVEQSSDKAKPHGAGTLVGQIEVVGNTVAAGEINGKVQVHMAGESRRPRELTVTGKVLAPVEITPSSIVLPRKSADGLVYSAECICRSTRGEPLSLVVDSIPACLKAEILSEGDAALRVVRITWNPRSKMAPAAGERQRICFRAEAGENHSLVNVDVLLDGGAS